MTEREKPVFNLHIGNVLTPLQPAVEPLAVVQHAHAHRASCLHTRANLSYRADGQYSSLLDDRYAIADLGQFGENMGADEYRLSRFRQPRDHIPQLDPSPWIETRRRLIQNQHRGIVN